MKKILSTIICVPLSLVGGILFDKEYKVWRLTNDDRYDGAYWGSIATNKNHGIIWALTKEELENE